VRGRVRKVVTTFMKIGRGVSDLWGIENRPLSLTRPMAYTTACTNVQAVIYYDTQCRQQLITHSQHRVSKKVPVLFLNDYAYVKGLLILTIFIGMQHQE